MPVPNYQTFFNPTLQAIKILGGSASIAEMEEDVPKLMKLSDQDIAEMHDERQTRVGYRMAWARTYLKAYGLLDNSGRGVWVITAKGKEVDTVDPREVTRYVRNQQRDRRQQSGANQPRLGDRQETLEFAEVILEQTWRDELFSKRKFQSYQNGLIVYNESKASNWTTKSLSCELLAGAEVKMPPESGAFNLVDAGML